MKNNKYSFSIIELLLTLSIVSMVLFSIYSIFYSGIKLSHRSQIQNNVYREARMAFNLIEKELENALFYDFTNSYPDKESFVGSSDKITFLIEKDGELKAVSYFLISANEGDIHTVIINEAYKKNINIKIKDEEYSLMNFLVRQESNFVDFVKDAELEENGLEIISSNIKERGLKFYYGYLLNKETEEISWKNEWKNNYNPSNLRVEIDFLNSADNSKVLRLSKEILVSTGYLGAEETP